MAPAELLSAVPIAAPGASLTALNGAGATLSLRVQAPSGFAGWLARTLGLERVARFELDALGLCYWSHVDGHRSLADIERVLSDRFALPSHASRRATIEFTAALMRRSLVALQVERP